MLRISRHLELDVRLVDDDVDGSRGGDRVLHDLTEHEGPVRGSRASTQVRHHVVEQGLLTSLRQLRFFQRGGGGLVPGALGRDVLEAQRDGRLVVAEFM